MKLPRFAAEYFYTFWLLSNPADERQKVDQMRRNDIVISSEFIEWQEDQTAPCSLNLICVHFLVRRRPYYPRDFAADT